MKIKQERRRHKRFKYEALVSHDVSTNDIIHTGKMFNFSKGGLYFQSDQNIYPGEDIFVGLAIHADSPGEDTQLIFEVKIVWQQELENSPFHFGFGGSFLNSYDSIDSFPGTGQGQNEKAAPEEVLQSGFSGENDSRRHSRRPYNKSLHFSFEHNDYKQFVTNIGRSGAFITTREKFPLGGKITLTVPGTQRGKEATVTGWIVRTSPEGIGVSFERRSGQERRSDLDRRTGLERRSRKRRKIS